MSFGRVKK